MILYDEYARILMKEIMAYFGAQPQCFLGETDKVHESLHQGEPSQHSS
jgi:hypothetical protein